MRQHIGADAIEQELGNHGLHLRDIAGLGQIGSQDRHVFLVIQGDFLQHEALADLLKQLRSLPHFREDSVSKARKRKHVDIQNAVPWVQTDKFLLCLHRVLLRHNDQEAICGMFHGLPDDLRID